jgi:hypothetical protein
MFMFRNCQKTTFRKGDKMIMNYNFIFSVAFILGLQFGIIIMCLVLLLNLWMKEIKKQLLEKEIRK